MRGTREPDQGLVPTILWTLAPFRLSASHFTLRHDWAALNLGLILCEMGLITTLKGCCEVYHLPCFSTWQLSTRLVLLAWLKGFPFYTLPRPWTFKSHWKLLTSITSEDFVASSEGTACLRVWSNFLMIHLSRPKGNKTPTPLLNAGKFYRVADPCCRGGVRALGDCSHPCGWGVPFSRAFIALGLTEPPVNGLWNHPPLSPHLVSLTF